jgi:hypothetical protein
MALEKKRAPVLSGKVAGDFHKKLKNQEKENGSVCPRRQDRKIGLLDGKVKIVFSDDFEMTTEELIAIR